MFSKWSLLNAAITTTCVFRTTVSQVSASPIFSLQIDPSPDSNTLMDNPIMMMFDVVRMYMCMIIHSI